MRIHNAVSKMSRNPQVTWQCISISLMYLNGLTRWTTTDSVFSENTWESRSVTSNFKLKSISPTVVEPRTCEFNTFNRLRRGRFSIRVWCWCVHYAITAVFVKRCAHLRGCPLKFAESIPPLRERAPRIRERVWFIKYHPLSVNRLYSSNFKENTMLPLPKDDLMMQMGVAFLNFYKITIIVQDFIYKFRRLPFCCEVC